MLLLCLANLAQVVVAPNGRSRAHIANILNYATPGLTNKKRLGTPLVFITYPAKSCDKLRSVTTDI